MSREINNLRRFGEFALDLDQRILWVRDVPAELPSKAVEVLCVLVENGGEVVSKNELLDRVWADSFVEEGVLTQNVYQLRKAFKAAGKDDELIQTVPRRGYRFAGEITGDRSFRNEITIERETFEQEYRTETEYDDQPMRQVHPEIGRGIAALSGGRTRQGALAAAVLISIVAAGAAGAWMFSGSMAGTAPANAVNAASSVEYERLTPSARALYVGLSHDNINAAYVIQTADAKYSLVLVHLGSKSETVVVPPQEKHLFNIQFSPDGSHIYYGATPDGGKPGIYRIPVYGGTPQLVTRRPVHHFSISPDGVQMAFYRRAPEENAQYLDICSITKPDDCRSAARLADGQGFKIWGTSPDWSPDGLRLLAATFKRDTPNSKAREFLSEIDLATGSIREIPGPHWQAVHQAYWSRDGRGIFTMVREKRGDPVQLWFLDPSDGSARRLTNDNDDYREFRPSADGTFIIAATWKKAENLFLAPADNPSELAQLTFDIAANNGAWGMAWMPDGSGLVFSKAEGHLIGNLWKMDLGTRETSQITFDEGAMADGPELTPDGKKVLYMSDRSGEMQIWEAAMDGSGQRELIRGRAGGPEVSPDGKWLYYVQDGLWKRPLEGGEAVKLLDGSPGNVRVSPADPAVFAAFYFDKNAGDDHPWKLGIFNENNLDDPIVLGHGAITFEWKPDGSGLYFVDRGETVSNLWFAPADGSSPTQLTQFKDQKISNFALSPDGKTFAISRGAAVNNVVKITLNR